PRTFACQAHANRFSNALRPPHDQGHLRIKSSRNEVCHGSPQGLAPALPKTCLAFPNPASIMARLLPVKTVRKGFHRGRDAFAFCAAKVDEPPRARTARGIATQRKPGGG